MDVTMPQLGETVTEGTITRWFKAVGDKIEADEPLFEVSTDKVDSEVPSPQAGYLAEIVVPEGETVPVGARLAVISEQAGAPAPAAVPSSPELAPAPAPEPEPAAASPQVASPPPAPEPVPAPAASVPEPASAPSNGGTVTSPLVRRLIAEEQLDPAQIRGTGEGGRITRNDVMSAARARGAPAGTIGVRRTVATIRAGPSHARRAGRARRRRRGRAVRQHPAAHGRAHGAVARDQRARLHVGAG
jgi:2-oxoglutarate dehydrogenase E2 component (dihydrolipoamide succinyltransferase)